MQKQSKARHYGESYVFNMCMHIHCVYVCDLLTAVLWAKLLSPGEFGYVTSFACNSQQSYHTSSSTFNFSVQSPLISMNSPCCSFGSNHPAGKRRHFWILELFGGVDNVRLLSRSIAHSIGSPELSFPWSYVCVMRQKRTVRIRFLPCDAITMPFNLPFWLTLTQT